MGAVRTTVVIPCYNDAATVGETVDSVREAEPVEIIVVDDGSRDPATVALLDQLAAAGRIRLVRKANGGVASALRAGFEAAQTPYVFVSHPTISPTQARSAELADALDREPEYDFAYGHSHHFGDVDFVRRAAPWNPWILLHSNLWEAACLFRREAVNAAGGFPDGSGYEDWDLFMALAERDSAGLLVDRLVFHYRIHGARARQPGRQDALSRALRHAPAQPPGPLRTRAGARVALPAAALVAPALPVAARGGAALAAGTRAPVARRQAPPAPPRGLGRRRAALAAASLRRPVRARAARRLRAARDRARR